MSTDENELTRRVFVQTMAVATVAGMVRTPAFAGSMRFDIVAAIGDLLIPSAPGDPGYKDLEPYHITDEVLKALPGVSEADATLWNTTPQAKFGGKTFLELEPAQRETYAQQVIDGTAADDPKAKTTLQRVFRNTRRRIVSLYYANFPEDKWPRDANGAPILKPGDQHQITNPNTTTLITGWDQSGFWGPLTWEEEERRRNLMKTMKGPRGKDGLDWYEGWSPFTYKPNQPKV